MNSRLRHERNTFLLFLGAVYICLMCALPIVVANLSLARINAAGAEPTPFEQLDRNRDGYIDRGEALAQPGLDAVFAEADRRADGRLDKVEFAKALALMSDGSRR